MYLDHWRPAGGVLVVALITFAPARALADDEFMASAQLRGGFDANPRLLSTDKRGSAFGGLSASLAAARGTADKGYGVIGDFERTDYSDGTTAPYEHYRLELKGMTEFAQGWSLRSSTKTEVARNYSVQAFDATQTLKLKAPEGPLRPFINGSLQYSTLNETNPILGDFLPSPQRFGRATVNPGVEANLGKGTVGVSAELSATHYLKEPDLFGYRRNNERAEPFLFATFNDQGLDLFASVSRLYGQWHDADFSNVKKTMFEASLIKEQGPARASLSAQRTAQDTTFPVSPIAIATRYGAEVGYKLSDVMEARLFGRSVRTEYLDSPFISNTRVIGIGVNYALLPDLSLGAEIARLDGTAMDGSAINGGTAMLSLKKMIAGAAREPPAALATNPSWDPRPVKSH